MPECFRPRSNCSGLDFCRVIGPGHWHERSFREIKMFPGMFMKKPDKAEALKQLRSHVAMFGAWVVAIRAAPYVLHFLCGEKDELKLEF
ncbi:unnamed protein product [Prunus brigantina]